MVSTSFKTSTPGKTENNSRLRSMLCKRSGIHSCWKTLWLEALVCVARTLSRSPPGDRCTRSSMQYKVDGEKYRTVGRGPSPSMVCALRVGGNVGCYIHSTIPVHRRLHPICQGCERSTQIPCTTRSRVRAIDERWEEVNVRATNTLDNIEEDDLDEKDPGRKRRSSNPVVDKRREAGRVMHRHKQRTRGGRGC